MSELALSRLNYPKLRSRSHGEHAVLQPVYSSGRAVVVKASPFLRNESPRILACLLFLFSRFLERLIPLTIRKHDRLCRLIVAKECYILDCRG